MTRKQTRKQTRSIYDSDIVAPDRLDVSKTTRNAAVLAQWFADAMLYLDAMEAVGRAVILKSEDDTLHLSSVEAQEDRS